MDSFGNGSHSDFLLLMQQCSEFMEICERMKTPCWDEKPSKITYLSHFDQKDVVINKRIGYI